MRKFMIFTAICLMTFSMIAEGSHFTPLSPWYWSDSSSHGPDSVLFADSSNHADLADSSLKIDTTYAPFQTYVDNHGGAGTTNAESLMTIPIQAIAGNVQDNYIAKINISGADTTLDWEIDETGAGSGSEDTTQFITDNGGTYSTYDNEIWVRSGNGIALDTIGDNAPESLQIRLDTAAVADAESKPASGNQIFDWLFGLFSSMTSDLDMGGYDILNVDSITVDTLNVTSIIVIDDDTVSGFVDIDTLDYYLFKGIDSMYQFFSRAFFDTSLAGDDSITILAGAIGDAEIDYSEVTLLDFDYQTAWQLFYSNTDGDVIELGLGGSDTYLKSNGASSAPTWDTPAGGGTVKADTGANVHTLSGSYVFQELNGIAIHIDDQAEDTLELEIDTVAANTVTDGSPLPATNNQIYDWGTGLFETITNVGLIGDDTVNFHKAWDTLQLVLDDTTDWKSAHSKVASDSANWTDGYDSSQVLTSTYETIANVALIGDDTTAFKAAQSRVASDSANWTDGYDSSQVLTATYETIANVGLIGDDTTNFHTAYDSSQVLSANYTLLTDFAKVTDDTAKFHKGYDTLQLVTDDTTDFHTAYDSSQVLSANYATLDDPTFTTGITVPNDAISPAELDEGGAFTWTSTHDFGGATSLEMPNGTAPAPTNEGELFWDTDDPGLEGTNGTIDFFVTDAYKNFILIVDDPDNLICDTLKIPIRGSFPGGIVIDSIGILTSTSTTYDVDFEEWTDIDFSTGTESAIATVSTAAGYEAASGGLAHTVEYDNLIAIEIIDTDDIGQLIIWIRYYMLGND